MSLLSRYLEQISFASETIASLPFPPPQIFTNALLSKHDITALIRDTEPHERALFSVPPPQIAIPYTSSTASTSAERDPNRRQTVFAVQSGEVTASSNTSLSRAAPRRNTAVAAVLGHELDGAIKRTDRKGDKAEIDVEVLLRGAEKLLDVFNVDGARERITQLRLRHSRASNSLRNQRGKVESQERELEGLNRGWVGEDDDDQSARDEHGERDTGIDLVTQQDLDLELEEIRELEQRKRELEDRVHGMEKDLGGLLR